MSATEDVRNETLARRARELAQTTAEEGRKHEIDVLHFRLTNERYAVELSSVRSVLRTTELTSVPCAPPHIAGIVNVRGEVVTVLNLATVLGLSGVWEPSSQTWMVMVQLPQGKVGLSVDDVFGMSQISLESLDRSMSGRDFVTGIHEGRTVLLDLALLLTPERLDVFEPVT